MITLTEMRPDGSSLVQTWLISSADRAFLSRTLRKIIGDPSAETIATAAAVQTISEMTQTSPGIITDFRDPA
ncbi:hypothetical protein [Streptosporangium sp. NPDC049376]|uniref:hypothetical protein n=1 Tax=Streptosporangium sp. NPDC049376 TaxID=3366192 RepID=UPI0037A0A8A1